MCRVDIWKRIPKRHGFHNAFYYLRLFSNIDEFVMMLSEDIKRLAPNIYQRLAVGNKQSLCRRHHAKTPALLWRQENAVGNFVFRASQIGRHSRQFIVFCRMLVVAGAYWRVWDFGRLWTRSLANIGRKTGNTHRLTSSRKGGRENKCDTQKTIRQYK